MVSGDLEGLLKEAGLPSADLCIGTAIRFSYKEDQDGVSQEGQEEQEEQEVSGRPDFPHTFLSEITGVVVVDDVIALEISVVGDEDRTRIDHLAFEREKGWRLVYFQEKDEDPYDKVPGELTILRLPVSETETLSPETAPQPQPALVPVIVSRGPASEMNPETIYVGKITRLELVPANVILQSLVSSYGSKKYRRKEDGTVTSAEPSVMEKTGWKDGYSSTNEVGRKDLVIIVEIL